MNVSLTPELERKVDDRVRSGMYGSASEVVREALRLFFRYDDALLREVDDLDRRIGIGLALIQLIGDHHPRRSSLSSQQLSEQALGRPLVAPAQHQDVEDDAGLVNRAPQPVLHPGDHDDDLIEVPFVARTGQPPPDLVGERLAELPGPLPHGLVAHDDAAGGQHLLDHAQTERKPEIQPDRVADDRGRESMAGVAGAGGRRHAARLPFPSPPRQAQAPVT